MMKVILGKGKGVVIKESGEDYEVNEASNIGNRGKLLFLDENDVETKTEASTSKVSPLVEGSNDSIFGFSVPDTNDHPSWSFESMNDPVGWQQDAYHEDDEAEETKKLFAELDQLLEHVAFLNDELRETMVGVDAPIVAVDALVVPFDAPVIALE
ncbi:hypothetical protein Tco_0344423 [Tanacetum coccineum]